MGLHHQTSGQQACREGSNPWMEDRHSQSCGRSPDGSGDDLLKQMSKNDPTFPSHILLAFVLFSTIFSSFQEHDFYKIWQKKNKDTTRRKDVNIRTIFKQYL